MKLNQAVKEIAEFSIRSKKKDSYMRPLAHKYAATAVEWTYKNGFIMTCGNPM